MWEKRVPDTYYISNDYTNVTKVDFLVDCLVCLCISFMALKMLKIFSLEF